jgi:hypothetical protein
MVGNEKSPRERTGGEGDGDGSEKRPVNAVKVEREKLPR